MKGSALSLLLVAWLSAAPAAAQDSLPTVPLAAPDSLPTAAPITPAAGDSVRRPPVSPMGAFWRSLLIPGWGQAKLDRKLTGGIFVAWEGVTLGMTLKAHHELGYLRRRGSSLADAKRQEVEDWVTLLVFNHLFSGLEAYVSAHLWDFPGDLQVQVAPGHVGAAVTLPLGSKR